jgi:ABC-type transport system involved in cytochrome bd biosynthesis fused ATPase/permease subunit
VTITLLLWSYLRVEQNQGTLLLISFWALRLPLEARALSAGLQRVPGVLAATGRLVEPLTAHESPADVEVGDEETLVLGNRPGMSLRFRDVGVVLGTHEVLAGFSLDIKGGAHIAIVGSSGAGKSSLLAVLLGLLERAQGEILVDGHPLERYDVGRLRRETVWVDPAVQLWNRSMLANLQFGNPLGARHPLDAIVEETELKDLLERMSKGFATPLGESGARVSGGEGQRVRLSRALLRRGARLVLLDEAFRGLDRRARRRFSKSVRARAKNVTLLEVTHDVADTQEFDRILVIEDGKLVEDGPPRALLATAGSRYAELVRADLDVQAAVWSASHWKRIILEAGSVRTIEAPAHAGATSSSAEAAPSTSESRPGERGAQ